MGRLECHLRESQPAAFAKHLIFPEPAGKNHFSPETAPPACDELAFLKSLGFAKPSIEIFRKRTEENGSSLQDEVLASGLIAANAYFAAFARFLHLPFLATLDAALVVDMPFLDTQLVDTHMLRLSPKDRKPLIAIVPELRRLAALKEFLRDHPHLRDDFIVTTPEALRQAVWEAGGQRRSRAAVQALFEAAPHHSARIVFHGEQGFYAGMALALLAGAMIMAPSQTFAWLHVAVSLLYLAALIFRLLPFVEAKRQRLREVPVPRPERALPVYSILVPLYREEAVVRQLVEALSRLEWPKSRLDIKLICEADDLRTIEAIERLQPGRHFEIVRVPPCLPRTKPKALNYAFYGVRGEFVAIYDAEDRPHPLQLQEAFARFRKAPDDVACLQAPLIVGNGNASWLSAAFAVEYAALFRRMLPVLGRRCLPLPLGGTSNHFRTAVLRKAGAWDPFNVTEDADLGMRLYRLGYRSEMIRRHTLEDAPVEFNVWLAQRTRWFKGWLQSWLVMVRSPLATAREMGWPAYLVFHLMIGGMLLSALTHPLLLVTVLITAQTIAVNGLASLPPGKIALLTLDALNIVGSYGVFIATGCNAMTQVERKLVGARILALPLYWLLLSLAAWRAVIELRTKPFVWNKTPHMPTQHIPGTVVGKPRRRMEHRGALDIRPANSR